MLEFNGFPAEAAAVVLESGLFDARAAKDVSTGKENWEDGEVVANGASELAAL